MINSVLRNILGIKNEVCESVNHRTVEVRYSTFLKKRTSVIYKQFNRFFTFFYNIFNIDIRLKPIAGIYFALSDT